MKKFDLDSFEFNIGTSIWDAAQDIMAFEEVSDLTEVEKNLWTASVSEKEDQFEVELLLTSKKLNGYTCDCWTEKQNSPCRHIAAAAASIRKHFKQLEADRKEARRKLAAKRAHRPPRITTAKVIEDVPVEALQRFLVDYARGNRDFSLAIKTRFAGYLDQGENPYKQLMFSLLPDSKQSNYPLKRTPFLRIRRSIQDLEKQAEQALMFGDFFKASQIITPVFKTAGPLSAASEDDQTKSLKPLLSSFMRKSSLILNSKLAPEFVENFENELIRLFKSYAMPDHMQAELSGILAHRSTQKETYQKIERLFENAPTPLPKSTLLLFTAALAANQQSRSIISTFSTFSIDPKQIDSIGHALYSMGFGQVASEVFFHYLEAGIFVNWQAHRIEDFLLEISPKLKKADFLPSILVKRFLNTGKLHFLENLKEKSGKKWSRFFTKIKKELIVQEAYPHLVLALAFEGDLDAIAGILKANGDLDAMKEATSLLAKKHPKWLKSIYVDHFNLHLQTHFGPPAARKITDDIQYLITLGFKDLAKEISRDLLKKNRDRKTLIMEIKGLFPRSMRSAF